VQCKGKAVREKHFYDALPALAAFLPCLRLLYSACLQHTLFILNSSGLLSRLASFRLSLLAPTSLIFRLLYMHHLSL
jgi:hypothetical protein